MTTLNPEDTAGQSRIRLKAAREAMSEAQRSRASLLIRARLFTWLANRRQALEAAGQPGPSCIAAFWPMAHEPDLRPLLSQWAEDAALCVVLPVVVAPDTPLTFHRWTPNTPMTRGAFGIERPAVDDPLTPDVVLVPTLGFTPGADRLGYGAGYYDRTLNALLAAGHKVTTIGIAWASGELDENYRPALHDQPLNAVLTEEGWTPAAPGERPGPRTTSLFQTRL